MFVKYCVLVHRVCEVLRIGHRVSEVLRTAIVLVTYCVLEHRVCEVLRTGTYNNVLLQFFIVNMNIRQNSPKQTLITCYRINTLVYSLIIRLRVTAC